jgi:fructose-1,6-bisphosphatase/inositol monophosphatase family enzyme
VTAPPARELEVLYRLGLAVERAARENARSPHRGDVVAMGASGTPTEELDRIAENAILRGLEVEGVDWNVVSEEAGRVDRGGRRTLVVDPIDGTANAMRGLPFSTVSLALGNESLAGIELGLVRDLVRGTTYWASRGGGAFRDGRPIHTRAWPGRGELVLVNLGRWASPRATALAGHARRVRALGCASLELSMVAEGAADAYLFDNAEAERNLRATDIAAGYRILLEAGGGASDGHGAALDDLPLDLQRRTSVVGWGDAAFGRQLREGGPP